MDAIRTEELTKRYGNTVAVDGLNLTVGKGELFALLGVNGAGKTTTVKMLCTLTRPTAGNATVGGYDILSQKGAVRQTIGVSPQETAVAPNLSVRENLALICGAHGFDKSESEKKIDAVTERLSLHTVSDKKAGKLSGGWQRRVSIAMALITDPEILFLDEPTLGLDVIARQELWEMIRSLKGRATVVLTTHYLEEAEALCDRIGIMRDGRLIAVGTATELKALAAADDFQTAFIRLVKGDGI